ncbi:MAG TPA: hypothetical protein VFR09_08420 [Alphaproteobacteria bacterium]|nr:hypothetical protein [Alphaproteobacteria bacterium]
MRTVMLAWAAVCALMIAVPASAATINMTIDTVDQVNGYDITLTGLTTDGSNVAQSLVSGTITGFGSYSYLTGALTLTAPNTIGGFAYDNVVTSTSPFFSNTGSSGIVLFDALGNTYLNPYNLSGTLYSSIEAVGGGSSNPGDLINVATFDTPLPASMPLFVAGLAAFGIYGARRKKAAIAA